jgi:hypothetical protein
MTLLFCLCSNHLGNSDMHADESSRCEKKVGGRTLNLLTFRTLFGFQLSSKILGKVWYLISLSWPTKSDTFHGPAFLTSGVWKKSRQLLEQEYAWSWCVEFKRQSSHGMISKKFYWADEPMFKLYGEAAKICTGFGLTNLVPRPRRVKEGDCEGMYVQYRAWND